MTSPNNGMPPQLQQLYNWLRDELALVHIKWSEFCLLYDDNQEIIDNLNKIAPAFFGEHQRMAWQDLFLHLCRITDRPVISGHDTLTVRRLRDAIPDQALRQVVENLIEDAGRKTELLRDWRNNRFAHLKLPTVDAAPLPPVSHADVEDALVSLREILNQIDRHYTGTTVLYAESIEPLGGVGALRKRLKR